MRLVFFARGMLAAWLSATALGLAVGSPNVPPYERFYKEGDVDQVAAGKLLLGELSCTSCHAASDAEALLLSQKQPPILDEITQRAKPDYLAKFLVNPPTFKPGTTMPSVLHGMSGDEAAKQAELLAHFLASLNPAGPEQSFAAIAGRTRGELLYNSIGCAQCHGSRKEGAKNDPYHKPLGNLEAKYTLPGLASFIQDPLHVRPSGRMPSLNLTSLEARDIAAYLLPSVPEKTGLAYKYYEGSWNQLPNFDELEPKAFGGTEKIDIGMRKRDDQFALRFEGALSIDTEGEYTFWLKSDDGSRLTIDGKVVVDNDGIHGAQEKNGKLALAKGSHLITVDFFEQAGGEEVTAEFAGPGITRRRLDTAIIAAQPKDEIRPLNFAVDAEKAKQGRELFVTIGCASCHTLRETKDAAPLVSKLAAPALAKLNAAAGCLAEKPSKAAVDFQLSADQRKAIAAALDSLKKPTQLATKDNIHSTLTRLNCYACHERGGVGGASDVSRALFQTTEPEMGDEGRVPPPLDGVGGKLNDVWLAHILADGAKDRPYMLARMPKFGVDNAGHLAKLLAETDKLEPLAEVKLPATESKHAGWRMVGEQGFGCIKCHTFGRFPSTGIQSMDMTIMNKRLREEWFRRYVDDPQAFRKGTRMPDAWPGIGEDSLLKILDGKKNTQIQAVWNFLSDGPRARTPVGAITQSMELIPTFEPIIYRNFIEGAGPRAIGVGYPEQMSLAFDANDLRLALIWQGAYIDASKHWNDRGSGFQGPAGQKVLSLPPNTTFAVLENPETEWPNKPAKEQGFQFRGYKLSKDGRPTFKYTLNDAVIEDFPNAVENGPKITLVRNYKITADKPVENLYLRAAVGSSIKPLDDGWYELDNGLHVRVSGGQATVRDSAGKKELLVRAEFQGKEAKLTQEYDW